MLKFCNFLSFEMLHDNNEKENHFKFKRKSIKVFSFSITKNRKWRKQLNAAVAKQIPLQPWNGILMIEKQFFAIIYSWKFHFLLSKFFISFSLWNNDEFRIFYEKLYLTLFVLFIP